MKETFDQGIAFVFEGDTEKYFYISLLKFWCNKYPNYTLVSRTTDYEEEYIIQSETKSIIVCINTVGTITQLHIQEIGLIIHVQIVFLQRHRGVYVCVMTQTPIITT